MEIKWDVSELLEFADHIAWIENFQADMTTAAKEIAKMLRLAIRNYTPVETRRLINGWKARYTVTPTSNGVKVEFTNEVDYATYVNYGHRAKNQYGGPYTVKRRTVALNGTWGQTANEYYVYGHFFLEMGVLDVETSPELDKIIYKHLIRWWKWCVNG